MSVTSETGLPWIREHDDSRRPFIASSEKTYFPNSLEDLIEICRNESRESLKAQGSHWSLSEAAVSDMSFIETHEREGRHPALGATLSNVVPHALTERFLDYIDELSKNEATKIMPFHAESGKRVNQLFAELDQHLDPDSPESFAGFMKQRYGHDRFAGSWALPTAGNSGGQTIAGVISTGTHGADFRIPPLSDGVLALHLVADGGKHYWIEPSPEAAPPITDDEKLRLIYGSEIFGGSGNFEIIRDDRLFDAVVVGVGRFGIIYSVMLGAVPQYNLFQERVIDEWNSIKHLIRDPASELYERPSSLVVPPELQSAVELRQHSLQIVVLPTPTRNFASNIVAITRTWKMEVPDQPGGRAHRVGRMVEEFNPILRAPLFESVGRATPWSEGNNPWTAGEPSLLQRACSNGSFTAGAISAVIEELEEFVATDGVRAGAIILGAAAIGGPGLLSFLAAFVALIAILKEILEAISDDTRLGEVLDDLRSATVGNPEPELRPAGTFVWQMLAQEIFLAQQGPRTLHGISYAMLDGKDYTDRSCQKHVASAEIFFDATSDELIAFVDALIAFEVSQQVNGRAFAGYASLRFTRQTRAFLGEQRFPRTCAVEVAGLRDIDGTEAMVDHAVAMARHPMIGGILHWGQQHTLTASELSRSYGVDYDRWRHALRRVTDSGRFSAFSSDYTRATGLEL